jgi:hypothetical protein
MPLKILLSILFQKYFADLSEHSEEAEEQEQHGYADDTTDEIL